MKTSSSCIALLATSPLFLDLCTAASLRGRNLMTQDDGVVLCHMLMLSTQWEESDMVHTKDESACIPVVEGKETDDLIPLDLPAAFWSDHATALGAGRLFVSISGAEVVDGDIYTTPDSEFLVVPDARKLQLASAVSLDVETKGDLTVAVIRIATRDSRCSVTDDQIERMFDESEINFVTQYEKCSFNQLRFKKAQQHLFDIYVDEDISYYGDARYLIKAAQTKLGILTRVSSFTDIADKLLFVVPPGTGTWVASAGYKHWRAQFNDQWVTSLSATMHEIGHLIGLLHANENGETYEDTTGYMSRSYRDADYPLRCFNGRKNHLLGWYNELELDPVQSPQSGLVNLTAFVYNSEENVALINIVDEVFLQYNRAVSFNANTGEMRNKVAITSAAVGGSELLGGVAPGETFEMPNFKGTGKALIIRACGTAGGDAPDMVTLSIGLNETSCEALPAPSGSSLKDKTLSLLQQMIFFLSWSQLTGH